MIQAKDLHEEWMEEEKYRKAHEELAVEYELARAMIAARAAATGTRLKISFEARQGG